MHATGASNSVTGARKNGSLLVSSRTFRSPKPGWLVIGLAPFSARASIPAPSDGLRSLPSAPPPATPSSRSRASGSASRTHGAGHVRQGAVDAGNPRVPVAGGAPDRRDHAPELLGVLRRLESRGKLETTQRLHQRCSQVFRFAIATGRAERDPAADLRGALATPKKQHRAALTDARKIGEQLRAIDGYSGQFVTLCALKLSPFVFLRPGEVRRAEWAEIDLDAAEWRIPALKMKMRSEHIVPLSKQAKAILVELKPLTGSRRYVFPSLRDPKSHMSENTVNAALRRLGYSGSEMTAHGFRAIASTRLNELGWAPDVIERQLAHKERNRVRAAYNGAQHLEGRKRMMQIWADYLDELRRT